MEMIVEGKRQNCVLVQNPRIRSNAEKGCFFSLPMVRTEGQFRQTGGQPEAGSPKPEVPCRLSLTGF
jgi:hypothetical protein